MTYIYDPQLDDLEYLIHQEENEDKLSVLGGPALPALGHAISGATGSAISNVLTYPLSLTITRLQVQHGLKQNRTKDSPKREDYKSIPDALRRIYAEEGGLSAFYSGCTQDTLKSMADSFLFFLAYNFVRKSRLEAHSNGRPAKKLPIHEELLVGMVSGAFSKFFTTPVQQIVTRKQTASMLSSSSSSESAASLSSIEIARQIREQKGIAGFWSGYSASLVLTLNPSLTMLFHETLLRVFVPREKRQNPGAKITFLLAALSKAMASTITYPFSLAKSRAQVSAKKPLDDDNEDKITKEDKARDVEMKAASKVRKDTIFESVYRIAQEEGIGGLYQGLSGEVLKGFFSHGLTMLMKEGIHKFVIQLYYLVLKAIKQYPSPEEITELAKETVIDARDAVVDAASDARDAVVEVAGDVKDAVVGDGKSDGTSSMLDTAAQSVAELYRKGKEETADIMDDYIPQFDDDDNGWGW